MGKKQTGVKANHKTQLHLSMAGFGATLIGLIIAVGLSISTGDATPVLVLGACVALAGLGVLWNWWIIKRLERKHGRSM